MGGEWVSGVIQQHGLGLGFLAVFVGGLALNLTPCVYPMLPVTLAFFSQQAGTKGRASLLAASYVAGIALSYAALGAVAARTGALFGSWLQSPVVLIWIATAIVALALSMFGLYEIQLPRAISNKLGVAGSGHGGAFVMGLAVGLVAAPCVGPFLVGLLLLMTQLGNPVLGFFLFFVLGLGMGVPSLVLAMAARRAGQLPKAGEWLIWSKKALGCILIGLALFFIRPLLPDGAVAWTAAALLLGTGVYLGWLEGSRSRTGRLTWFRRATGIACVLIAATVVWPRPPRGPALTWRPFSAAALEEARRAGRPAIVDAYADWCLPCVELDHVTFRHPQVVAALQHMATLRIDATSEVSEDAQELFRRYNVYGVPTVLLFNRRGEEQRDVRVMGFVTPEEFLQRIERLTQ